MPNDQLDTIQQILSEADTLLRTRLREAGISVAHVMLAVNDEGTGIIRSNVDADALREMAELLDEIAENEAGQPN